MPDTSIWCYESAFIVPQPTWYQIGWYLRSFLISDIHTAFSDLQASRSLNYCDLYFHRSHWPGLRPHSKSTLPIIKPTVASPVPTPTRRMMLRASLLCWQSATLVKCRPIAHPFNRVSCFNKRLFARSEYWQRLSVFSCLSRLPISVLSSIIQNRPHAVSFRIIVNAYMNTYIHDSIST